MKLADGRTLAYSEWGDLRGSPLVLLHGEPGSRLMCPDVDATEAAGVRLITIDRPGYGRSDPRPDRTLLSWVDDWVELADHLELPSCPVVGWSGGGPYALACAYRLPERVPAIGLAGSPGLVGEVPGALDDYYSPEGRANYELFQRDRAAGTEAITKRAQWYDGDGWQTLLADSGDNADDRLLTRADVLETFKACLREGARQGSVGYTEDGVAEAGPAGFSVAAIQQEVHVWIGEADPIVSRLHADYLVRTIPRAALVSFPGEGHLFLFDHWAEMLTALS
jgi:pimeloyl-ACP methyl ester carboxylesterase